MAISAELYYIRKIYQRKVRLSLSGFLVFFLSALLGGGSTVAISGLIAGAVPLSFATLQLWMLYAAYSTGHHSGWDHLDTTFIIAAALCGAIWLFFDLPVVALICSLIIDFISYASVTRKMLHFPASEDIFAWSLAFVSYSTPLLVAFHDGGWSLDAYALSLLNAVGSLTIVILDATQRRKGH